MTRYKILLEYDGRNTVGWQIQGTRGNPNAPSIQGLVQDAIFAFCGERVDVLGAGRTDAGVHAIAMPAHFDLEKDADTDTIRDAVNFHLRSANAPVSVLSAEIVSDDFHARFDCKMRHYRYIILNRRAPAILDDGRVWWIPRPLNIDAIRDAAQKFIGNHDWTSFRSSECQGKSPIKTLDKINISTKDNKIIIDVSAQSFLHHQVRNIVGTLAEIGLGKPYDIDEIFAAKNRSVAGPTAPPDGLYFVNAEY
ncbi:MAG: tRNA pseudouridine(38-40) synthase TruA [Alphaproteobacteria bacterium]|nr:tRNA pseudouridine(38-40) synthase TruA [Alphaproteobacteria bacterium]MCL2889801.1 tRNA pseudouridine(38-40) synthase TruA [Alphaproteobacteria bacterium]